MLNNVVSGLVLINACSSGKVENVPKCESIFLEFQKSLKRKRKKKKLESCLLLKGVREEQDKEIFSEMASWLAMVL